MRTLKRLIVSLMIVLSLVGCSTHQMKYATDLALINNDVVILEERYNILTTMARSKWDKLTPEEQTDLTMIDGNVSMIFSKVHQIKSNQAYNVTLADIGYMYTLAKDSYQIAKSVVQSHNADLTRSETMMLGLFDQQLRDLDTKVSELMNNPNNTDINTTLISILALGGTALRLLLPVVAGF